MSGPSPDFPDDKTAPERRKNLTEHEIKDLKLAGGVEGGMQAGAGGPVAPDHSEPESGVETSHKTKSRQFGPHQNVRRGRTPI